jgi:hypothetical protein
MLSTDGIDKGSGALSLHVVHLFKTRYEHSLSFPLQTKGVSVFDLLHVTCHSQIES